jgi:sugar/nucleoside kinase (ribokinase family)
MNLDVLVIGDLNTDIIVKGIRGFPTIGKEILFDEYDVVIGGSGGIFANVVSQIGCSTGIISKISDDFFGEFLIKKCIRNGVKTELLNTIPGASTGLTLSLSYPEGKSQISELKLLKTIKSEEIIFDKIDSLRHIHFSSYFMMDSLKKNYIDLICRIRDRFKNITISFDTNDDSEEKWDNWLLDIFKNIDILFLNEREALGISRKKDYNEALNLLCKLTKIVIIKLGKDGYVANIDGKIYKGCCYNSLNKNFLDSTGAGDNFDAGFVFGFLKKINYEKNLLFANYCGETSVEYIGGVGGEVKYKRIKKYFKSLL